MTLAGRVRRKFKRAYLSLLSDEAYVRDIYRLRLGRNPDLVHPLLFSEKVQWLKLHEDPVYKSRFVDKLGVRAIVTERIGAQYLNELYFSLEDAEHLHIDMLPSAFVLKATHGSGFVLICKDRNAFDIETARRTLSHWLSYDYGSRLRERQYCYVPRKIICERYLEDDSGSLRDYKVLCFDGVPRLIWVDVDRQSNHQRAFFTTDWTRMPVTLKYPDYSGAIGKPGNLSEMLDLARELSRGFQFSRIDFYFSGGRTIFGEVTFHPEGGFAEFEPLSFGREVGAWIPVSSTTH
ncbi:MAG TPA: ATP-grasp fold amidoligase family protein [Gammaproteobacteria bacterium]|nr:ATP-grasp fold amidoligase family protein [Gammaproteobacteria bacterium]